MACPVLTPAEAARILNDGGVVAYPTEAVYGLGCDPFNYDAVVRILDLKGRPESAGLILIADEFSRVDDLIAEVSDAQLDRALGTWPGPVTWLFPKSPLVPGWISGEHDSIALRITDHPACRELCAALGRGIVSTSANRSGQAPARIPADIEAAFGAAIDGIMTGELGGRENPSEIRDIRTGEVVRPA
ncbi:MAG: Sua5/YciO/YrdC/YwlC family protein [Xanthomonadales bacterium]|nr:Sua5/YciO/YrdC/YwlC family protein [Xanthomonadales bacterium]